VGLVQQNPDGSYRLSDLAWGAEAWMMLRLHISPSAVGDPRDLLAATLHAQTLEGQTVKAHAAMLSLPVVAAPAYAALAMDEAVERRLQELEFALASETLRQLVQRGDTRAAQTMLAALDKRFAQNPWLRDKLVRLRTLANEDTQMMSKEIRFSAMRMSNRLTQKSEVAYSCDETNMPIPSFLRKKVEEGKGRRQK